MTKSYQPADTAVRSCSGGSHRSHDALLIAAVRDTEGSTEGGGKKKKKTFYNCLEERGCELGGIPVQS